MCVYVCVHVGGGGWVTAHGDEDSWGVYRSGKEEKVKEKMQQHGAIKADSQLVSLI